MKILTAFDFRFRYSTKCWALENITWSNSLGLIYNKISTHYRCSLRINSKRSGIVASSAVIPGVAPRSHTCDVRFDYRFQIMGRGEMVMSQLHFTSHNNNDNSNPDYEKTCL